MLTITRKPIGMGKERMCFVHPEDPRLAIKIPIGDVDTQTRRELRFYRQLEKRGVVEEKHIPGFHGVCETNRGRGIVVDLVRNHDGEISRPLNWYLAQGFPIEEFVPYLEELKQSFLKNLIIFNHDMTIGNILIQKTAAARFRMVAIDGLGDVVAFDWPNSISFLVRRKIRRRWERFMERVYNSREVRLQRETQAR
ncbi:MAG: YrbL family protein, partial [Gammaproteobacteria bacterium]